MSTQVVVVDDESRMGELLAKSLPKRGFETTWFTRAEDALEHLRDHDADVLLTDLKMPGMGGIETCRRALEIRADLPVIVVTAFGSLESAIEAIRAGAYDFVRKPFDIDDLCLTLERAAKHRELRGEVRRLRAAVTGTAAPDGIIGRSEAIREVHDLVDRVAATDASILVTGESGTGKELVARALWRRSQRAAAPFITVNCAALPEALLESELFGHKRGAFTDARTDREGLFLRARGGTIFLDEIAEMPLGTQPKLLRALQERRIRAVGSDVEVDTDVRIIAATHQDLDARVADGRFREDLFYRIDVVRIGLPPLRARGNDVLLLAQRFLEQFALTHRRAVERLSPGAAERLLAYSWPGNVRELANCMERSVALARFNEVAVEDLPERVRSAAARKPVVEAPGASDEVLPLAEIERRYVLAVLETVSGNKTEAARLLGLDRATLYRWLEKYAVLDTGAR
ncbi:MAG: sigma-54-dependent Fis family transcriptional regulator [Polyangiaceae bacterium]|nr:sigma-54-dependent Fis family transcriptional regulator [Polyangiaceae bacterium]